MLPGLSIQATLLLIFASYLVLTSLVMLWVGLGRAHWFCRAMAAVLWVALFVPPQMDDLALLTEFLGALIVLPCWLVRGIHAWRMTKTPNEPAPSTLRFGIRDLLLAVIPVAVAASIGASLDLKLSPVYLLVVASLFAAQTLSIAWLVFGRGWITTRLLVSVVIIGGVLAIIWTSDYVTSPFGWSGALVNLAYDDSTLFASSPSPMQLLGCAMLVSLTTAAILATVLAVTRLSKTPRRVSRLCLRTLAAAALVPPLVLVGWTYWRTMTPLPSLATDYPTPNAYMELQPLALKWNKLKVPHMRKANRATIEAFLATNQDELQAARDALAHSGKVNLDGLRGQNFLLLEMGGYRQLIQSLELLARDKSQAERANIGRDLLRMSDRTSANGIGIQRMVASVEVTIGTDLIQDASDSLGRDQCVALSAELLELEQRLESPESIAWRDKIWTLSNDDWTQRVAWAATELTGEEFLGELFTLRQLISRDTALLRLLRVELALREYYLDNNAWPARLDELFPKYLNEIPLDPFDNAPLKYRQEGEKYVVYSIGPDSQDSGGMVGTPAAFSTGDIRLDMFELSRQRQKEAEANEANAMP